LRRPFRLVWTEVDRRPRFPVRLLAGFVLFLALAGAGNQFRPTLLSGDGPLVRTVNMIGRQLPNAVGLTLAVVVAALLIDRRRLTDLGLQLDQNWWRGLVGGTALGAGITLFAVGVGLTTGYYEFIGFVRPSHILVWILLAIGGAIFQLIFVVPEELFVRGYLITNVVEGFESVRRVPRWLAAGIGVLAASGVFYATHTAGKGEIVGAMMGALSILLGLGYVLSGDLSVPIGIHFGFNFLGVLAGTNAQPASVLRITSSTTVQGSLALPLEAVIVRLVGAVLATGLFVAWYVTVGSGLQVVPDLTRPTLRWKDN
jgi:membrane protease YdiL (CAAX protease family)